MFKKNTYLGCKKKSVVINEKTNETADDVQFFFSELLYSRTRKYAPKRSIDWKPYFLKVYSEDEYRNIVHDVEPYYNAIMIGGKPVHIYQFICQPAPEDMWIKEETNV